MQGDTSENMRLVAARHRAVMDWRYLLLALLLHLALLLLPLRQIAPPAPRELTVELWLEPVTAQVPETANPLPDMPVETPPSEAVIEPGPVPEPTLPAEPDSLPARDMATITPPEPEQEPQVAEEVPPRDAILASIADWKWQEPAAAPSPLGHIHDHDSYAMLSKRILPLEENLFDDYLLPSSSEVLDQWQEPGGVQRMVVRLPNGETLCARQEPVNDFRPWEQMPMMFGRCGGGGKR
jgi:hypothetical protein